MTATADFTPHMPLAETPRMIGAQRLIARVSRRMVGSALVLAAFGLWIAPGGTWDADLAMMKLGMSMFIGFAGLAVLSGERSAPSVKIEIDTVRREVRLIRGRGRAKVLVNRTAMRDLGSAEVDGSMMRLWGANGALVAEVAMSDPAIRSGLMSILRDEGKLYRSGDRDYARAA